MAELAPYGSWHSPITAQRVMSATARLGEVAITDDAVFWSEGRPAEGGRIQIVKRTPDGELFDLLPDGFSASSSVHEYGGGAWWVDVDTLFFVNGADQRIYRCDPGFVPGSKPTPVTPAPRRSRGLRYADASMTPDRRFIVCVQEAHPGEQGLPRATECVNRLVAVPAVGGEPVVLREHADFVMSPRVDRLGEWVVWVEWSHPNMPWDATELWMGRLDTSSGTPRLVNPTKVVGDGHESIVQPRWDHDNHLWFCSDRNDWWNLYHFDEQGAPTGEPHVVAEGPWEVGTPPWVFGLSRYDFLSDDRVVFAYSSDGIDHLAVYDQLSTRVDRLEVPFTSVQQVQAWTTTVVFVGGSFTLSASVVATVVGRNGATSRIENMRPVADPPMTSAYISVGQPVTYPTVHGVAHGIYYPPTNPDFVAPEGTRPPLVVMIHGGPTASATPELSLRTQYWTSRGFAVVDVNHRGSTGFGRQFRDLLRGEWGVVDVEDCIAAGEFLIGAGRADPDRLIIRGGSAGGFTTLAALTFHDAFSAGCSLYGIADLELLVGDDHKFESRYTFSLVANLPEGREVFIERSPIHHIERLTAPVILFQGTEDLVVPANQAEVMAAALDARGVPHSAVFFAGEGHGFRQADNIVRCLEAELSFYAQTLGFPHPEGVDPVEVKHL